MKKLLGLLALVFAISSCHTLSDIQIEKRHYRKGYYVHIRPHRYTEPVEIVRTETTTVAVVTESKTETKDQPEKGIQQEQRSSPPVSQASSPPPVSAAPPIISDDASGRDAQRSDVPMRRINHE